MISVEDALQRVLALATPLPAETVPLVQAHGRVLVEAAMAARAQPPFAASAMDGYAVLDPVQTGQTLTVIGEAQAGGAYDGPALGMGQAIRIFTGAPIPQGATRVVIQEDVTREGDRITLTAAIEAGHNIRPAGVDFEAGHLLAAPRRLRPADLALLAAMNVPNPVVARRPKVALIATGDELVLPGEMPRADQIIASNIYALKAMAEAEGAEVRLLPIARDTLPALGKVLELAEGADVIVTIGGASVGDHDLVGQVVASKGLERAFYKVAMRPGKPLMAGRLGASVHLGLPGNPVSAIVCGHLFLLPLLRAMQGLPAGLPQLRRAPLAVDIGSNGPRSHYMRAQLLEDEATGALSITPWSDQDSSRLVPLSQADALLVRPPHDPARKAGESVTYMVI